MTKPAWWTCLLLAGCGALAPVTGDDVIVGLTFQPAQGDTAHADGMSRAVVTITTANDPGRDPALSATLELTAGSWEFPDPGDPKMATVALKDTRESRRMILPRQPGELDVTAQLDGFTKTQPLQVQLAPVAAVTCSAQGTLPTGTDPSAITMTALLEAQPDGALPSIGTPVDFVVTMTSGTGGYPALQRVLITDAAQVSATFTALPGTTGLEIQASSGAQRCPPVSIR
jgi:hypothetical protein